MRTLLGKQIDGTLMRLAMDANVGDGVEPDVCGGLDGAELSQLEPTQEVLFDVADARLHAALLISARDIAGGDCKAIVASKIDVAGIEHRRDAGEALQDGRFKIIDHDFCGDAIKRRERMLVAGEEMLHRLGDGELHIHLPAIGEDDDEEREPAARVAHCDRAKGPPVDLRTLARSEVQLEIDRQLGLPDAADVVAQDRDAAPISLFAQALEDLLRAIGVRVQQPCDAPLEGAKEAAAWGWSRPLETRTCQPLGNRPRVEGQGPGDLCDRQALAIMAVADLAERLVVDHAEGLWDRARISRPRRSNRSVARTRSSCSGVPTR